MTVYHYEVVTESLSNNAVTVPYESELISLLIPGSYSLPENGSRKYLNRGDQGSDWAVNWRRRRRI
jgi:hypothetical protein